MVLRYTIYFWIFLLPSFLGGQNNIKNLVFDAQDTVFLVKGFGGNFKTKILITDSNYFHQALEFFKIDPTEFQNLNIQLPFETYFSFPKDLIKRYKDETYDTSPHIPICYIAEKGDTYYTIARQLFGIPLITLMRRNQIIDQELKIGSPVLIGWYSLEDTIKNSRNIDYHNPVYLGNIDQIKVQYEIQNGIAIIEGNYGLTNRNLALSNKYPLGTEILIYNPVTGLALKIEIVGKIPLTLYDDSISFVIGEDIANRIGARDKKFHIGILQEK